MSAAMTPEQQIQMRGYLLGRLADADCENVELRLLTDAAYAVELDIVADELIDEYVQGQISEVDRPAFEVYFLRSKVRQDKLAFALALRKRKTQRTQRAKLYKLYLPTAAAAMVILALGLGPWRLLQDQSDINKGLAALQSAYRDQRPVQARISGLDYAPVLQERGGMPKFDSRQRDIAGRMLLNAPAEHPSTAAHHALGKYYLSERQFDKAIEQLEAALQLDSQNPQIHSDLGAALFELGKTHDSDLERGRQIKEFGKSLKHLDRALELDASLLPAIFNRALLYQSMELPRKAEEEWQHYLERDPSSRWADEARQHLTTLKDAPQETSRSNTQALQDFLAANEQGNHAAAWTLVSWNYTSAGNTIGNDLLDSYLDLQSKGEANAAHGKLKKLEYLGQLEFHHANDRYIPDLIRFYENSSLKQRPLLIRARALIRKGYELYLGSNLNEALRYFTQAREVFEEMGNEAEATFAEYFQGLCYLLQADLKRSEDVFARLRSSCEQKKYRWLLNQSLYRTASIRLGNNAYSESIEYAHKALQEAERIPDNNSILKLLILLGDQYRSLNNQNQSLEYFARALTLSSGGAAEPLQLWGIFTGIALNLKSLDSDRAALAYQKEALRLALAMKAPSRPLIISRSYDYIGLTYARLALYQEALTNVELGFQAARTVANEPSGQEMMANSSLHAGDIHRQFAEYDQAVAAYDRSIQIYETLNYRYFAYPAHKGKLLAFMAQGNDDATEQQIETVLGLFEQYHSKLTIETQRNSFFDVEQSIYDLSIDFVRSRKQNERLAYDYSELSHARSLRDAIQARNASKRDEEWEIKIISDANAANSSYIQQRMPEQTQIVQYAVLDNKLIIWLVNRTKVTSEEVPLDAQTLKKQVEEFLRGVNQPSASREAETAQAARKLYDILIKPIESHLDKAKLLCIVPDKFLNYLPFATVISPVSGRYLVEDFSLNQAPSSTVFVDSSRRARQKTVAVERLLSVGDPSFDRNAFPALNRLPSAGREAKAIADLYPGAHLLLSKDATERAVRSEIEKANVLHFALHYVVNERSSLLSQMALAEAPAGDARDQNDDGVWQVWEISQMKLPEARLVVLSACQTGIERHYRGEGAISIARPFLVAGVPLVVASLWPVDSESTEKLMISFHHHRTHGGLPTAQALRQAQREMISGEDTRYRQPYYWAAFTTIGGYTEY